jgi:alpha-beta hydrolase superfamily lysophospholipase
VDVGAGRTFRYASSDDGQITAYRWDAPDEPRAVIQLTHGMGEHAQRYDYDWLSRDEAIVDAYIADPYCGFGIDVESAKQMFVGARRVADPDAVWAMTPDLPVYVAVGEADPVNGGLALLAPLTSRYAAAGLADVTVRTYPDARHEILNETNRDEVIGELITWIDRVVTSPDPGR